MAQNATRPPTHAGHRNAQTIKGVSFFGLRDEWVMSGSDDGHIYIWDRDTGRLRAFLKVRGGGLLVLGL